MARRFGHRSDLRDLFHRLAEEEEQHAQRIRLLARRQGEAAWDPDLLSGLAWGLDSIAAELVGLARSGDPEISGFFAALSRQDERHKDLLERTLGA